MRYETVGGETYLHLGDLVDTIVDYERRVHAADKKAPDWILANLLAFLLLVDVREGQP